MKIRVLTTSLDYSGRMILPQIKRVAQRIDDGAVEGGVGADQYALGVRENRLQLVHGGPGPLLIKTEDLLSRVS